ncbi:MAG: nucleotide pyrophosphohydrolase [Candidatus Lokiarchaeota archaeon]|nr:nucleotide pyrophosphohydrolase [Candidatus Lokiarchaeota archaeon]
MRINEFQNLMKELYFHQDSKRGIEKTFIWLVEEVGELASNLLLDNLDKRKIENEMADIVAWICSLANLLNIKLEDALFNKYPNKCIKCDSNPCICDSSRKNNQRNW